MKKIAVFCIPAHGHTNPMLPVAEELVRRGDEVRFYSFEDFRKKSSKPAQSMFPVIRICRSCRPQKNESSKTYRRPK